MIGHSDRFTFVSCPTVLAFVWSERARSGHHLSGSRANESKAPRGETPTLVAPIAGVTEADMQQDHDALDPYLIPGPAVVVRQVPLWNASERNTMRFGPFCSFVDRR